MAGARVGVRERTGARERRARVCAREGALGRLQRRLCCRRLYRVPDWFY